LILEPFGEPNNDAGAGGVGKKQRPRRDFTSAEIAAPAGSPKTAAGTVPLPSFCPESQ